MRLARVEGPPRKPLFHIQTEPLQELPKPQQQQGELQLGLKRQGKLLYLRRRIRLLARNVGHQAL